VPHPDVSAIAKLNTWHLLILFAERFQHADSTFPGSDQSHLSNEGRLLRHKVSDACFSSNTYLVLRRAALDGVGIGLLPRRQILDDSWITSRIGSQPANGQRLTPPKQLLTAL
jgi:DNA-binding transcriptional LysR family regulator